MDYDHHFAQFIAEKHAIGRSHYTITKYRLQIGYFIRWISDQPITRPTLISYLAHLRHEKQNASISNYFADAANFCQWLVDNGALDHNPAAKLKPRRTIRRMPSYTRSQIQAMLRGASVRDRALIIAFADTGLRLAEMVSLTRSGVDWASGHFSVVGKSDKQRSGWFSVVALHAIKQYVAERSDTSAALWVNQRGQPLSHGGIRHVIEQRITAAGITQEVSRIIHSFRATFAKSYLKSGGDSLTLAALLGHSTLAMTRRYSELADDELGAMKQRINPLAAVLDDAA